MGVGGSSGALTRLSAFCVCHLLRACRMPSVQEECSHLCHIMCISSEPDTEGRRNSDKASGGGKTGVPGKKKKNAKKMALYTIKARVKGRDGGK